MDPALARGEGEARDVLVRTGPGVPALRTAARAGICPAVTVQLGAGHSANLTPALVTALHPLRPLTVLHSLQHAVQGAVLLGPPLALAAVGPSTVDAGGGGVAGGQAQLALVLVDANRLSVGARRILVGAVACLALAQVPAKAIRRPISVKKLLNFIEKNYFLRTEIKSAH